MTPPLKPTAIFFAALALVCLLFGGCAAPSPRLVSKLAHKALTESSRQYGAPVTDPAVIENAIGILDACSAYAEFNLPISNAPASPEVGEAIERTLPFAMTTTDCARVLRAASRQLRSQKP